MWKENSKLYPLFLAVLSSILLWIGFPPQTYTVFLVFIGFIPLLILEKHLRQTSSRKFFWYSFISFLFWNILTTWWIWYASEGGAITAIVLNSFLMMIPFNGYHLLAKRLGKKYAQLGFVCFWVCFEYIHHNWDGTWPWLTLGNIFSHNTWMVQWYEVTGHLGGSVWILIINLILFNLLTDYQTGSNKKSSYYKLAAWIGIPMFISVTILMYRQVEIKGYQPNGTVLIVQPNLNPYTEKWEVPMEQQIKNMVLMCEEKMDTSTRLIMLPETYLTDNINEQETNKDPYIQSLVTWLQRHPKTTILTGSNTYTVYPLGSQHPATARKRKIQTGNDASTGMAIMQDIYYDVFNTATALEPNGKYQHYRKSRLVPGVEKMPFPKFFGFLESFSIDIGGMSGTLGSDSFARIFKYANGLKLAPVICYESIFGGYVTEYIRKGAGFIAIITNDGWWKDTDGYKQHLAFGKLRAIENRRYIYRSANTGISGYINSLGELVERTKWEETTVMKAPLYPLYNLTFYSRFGDWIGLLSCGITFVLIVLYQFKRWGKKPIS